MSSRRDGLQNSGLSSAYIPQPVDLAHDRRENFRLTACMSLGPCKTKAGCDARGAAPTDTTGRACDACVAHRRAATPGLDYRIEINFAPLSDVPGVT